MMLTTLHRYHRNVLNGQDSRNRHWCSCGMLASPIRQPGFQFWLDPQFQLPADGDPERQQLMGQIIGSLPPTGTPGLSSWLGHLGVKQQMGSPTPPHPVCMCMFVYVLLKETKMNGHIMKLDLKIQSRVQFPLGCRNRNLVLIQLSFNSVCTMLCSC